jgi:MFS family permease
MNTKYAWYRDLNRYQWFVLLVCSFGWMFDLMAQQLFSLARKQAIRELLGGHASDAAVAQQAGFATSVLMVGWAVGGVVFGVLGDRIGRVKTMALTILFYSLFTGASMFATGIWDFNLYRFLCGLGVGGLFSVGVSLVAEVVPARARPYALGTLQAFSTIGNMLAASIGILLGYLERSGTIGGAWRYEFLAGAVPAPLALLVFRKLKEPEAWLKARAAKTPMGSWRELFSEP